MSSKHKRSSQRDYYPTRWSDWEWQETYQRDARYREVSKGQWEWEYADPPSLAEPQGQPSYSQHVESTAWTPRGRHADPQGTLNIIPEQSHQDEEPQTDPSDNYVISSGINEGLADMKMNPYPETRYNQDDRYHAEGHQYPQDQYYSEGPYRHKEREKGKDSNSDSRQGRGERGKSRVEDTPYEETQRYSSDHLDPSTRESGQDQHSSYEGPQVESTQGHYFQYPASSTGTEQSLHSTLPASRPDSTQSYGDDQPYTGQNGSYNGLGPIYSAAPTVGSQRSSYAPSLRTSNRIFTRNPESKHEKLDSRFRVHLSKEFEFGKVFKVLWSEPIGAGGTEITDMHAVSGWKAFHKIRRFLIIKVQEGHSLCIPILTYGYQGVLKHGVHPETHTVAYSSRRDGPYVLDGERRLMSHRPIRIEIKDSSHKLDQLSRINYAKTYTVEHNVKVLFIGRVASNHEQAVVTAFNETHPPLSARPYPERPDSPVFSYAQGMDPTYPGAMPIPTSPTTWGTSSTQQYPTSYPAMNVYSPSGTQPYGMEHQSHQVLPRNDEYHRANYTLGGRQPDSDFEAQYGPSAQDMVPSAPNAPYSSKEAGFTEWGSDRSTVDTKLTEEERQRRQIEDRNRWERNQDRFADD